MTKFLLDSGDPDEYKTIAALLQKNNSLLWGATTNPSLIAKKLAGKKISQQEALRLQKDIVLEILAIVPGAVSAEVYADENTTSEEMIIQGKEIATWHERIVVKLPTTLAGFHARTALRKEGIVINNTLVFNQQQVFAICLHEQLVEKTFAPKASQWPSFISPFVGRLDDIGEDGMSFVKHAMALKKDMGSLLWMLEASIRTRTHMQQGIAQQVELVTAPAKIYQEWFENPATAVTNATAPLTEIPQWQPSTELRAIDSLENFFAAIDSNTLDITHSLTDKGIARFVTDWQAILA